MKLSIIAVVYNRATLLARLLNSLASQKDNRWEVIICDDGSSDKSVPELSREFIKYHNGKYIRLKVDEARRFDLCRPSVVVNSGQRHITGDIVSYWGGDNEAFLPTLVGDVLSFFEYNKTANCAYTGIVYTERDYRTGKLMSPTHALRTFNTNNYGGIMSDVFTALDSCQFYHRSKYRVRWPTSNGHWMGCDSDAIKEIVNKSGGKVFPIGDPTNQAYVINNLTPASLTVCGSPQQSFLFLNK